MKNLKEKQLAKTILMERLGFAPKMEDIIPLESTGGKNYCDYVMFTIKFHEDIIYRVDSGHNITIEYQCCGKEISM